MRKEQIYDYIVERISFFQLKPGQSIKITEIAKELGVSITPVREVFIKLTLEKLINVFPQSGTYISLIDLDFAREAIYMRHTLEKDILKQVIDELDGKVPYQLERNLREQQIAMNNNNSLEFHKLDNEFHRSLFQIVNHEKIWDIIQNAEIHYKRLRILDLEQPGSVERTYQNHVKIIKLIEHKETNTLTSLLNEHHFFKEEYIKEFIDKHPDFFVMQDYHEVIIPS